VEPDELVETVRRQAARGDGWVKLVGDWIDRDSGDLAPCWPLEALRPAIAAAHEAGARVTAHCFAEDSLADLVEAGIDCIEHATGLGRAHAPAARRAGGRDRPDADQHRHVPRHRRRGGGQVPAYAAHLRALHERRHATVGAAHDAGLPVFAGTDAGGSLAHGRVVDEVLELARAGLSPVEALSAACWSARAWLGRDALRRAPRPTSWSWTATPARTCGPAVAVGRGAAGVRWS
jgi:hypothetical protein